MREVSHHGVHIDTCTQCRGVWLDRGELEKIGAALGGTPGSQAATPASEQYAMRPIPRRRDYDDDDDDRRHGGYPQKKRGFLDFFD